MESRSPRVSSILLERQERIDEDIRKAEEFRKEADEAVAAYEKLVADARSDAQDLIRAANESWWPIPPPDRTR